MIDTIYNALAKNLAYQAWKTDNEIRGAKVERFRRYVDGDFDYNMTTEMRNQMRLRPKLQPASSLSRRDFVAEVEDGMGANYCDTVVQTMSDRLTVEAVMADNDAAGAWAADVLDWNRFDGLQMDVHESELVDGDTYIMVTFDRDEGMPVLTHELAWDGVSGMLVVHKRSDKRDIDCAIKVWHETRTQYMDTVRVNYYYPDRVEKYISTSGANLTRYQDEGDTAWPLPWKDKNGKPLGVPVVQFSNHQRGKSGYGLSEVEYAIPLQDALNRSIHSMIMAAELSAFQIRYSIGTAAPSALTPGMILEIVPKDANGNATVPNEKQIEWLKAIRFGSFEQGEIVPYISQAQFLIDQIRTTTRTPNPESLSADASGESRKQAEAGLLGKIRRFKVKAGNSWESVMEMAHAVQAAFGNQPPAYKRFTTRWQPSEIRSDITTVDNAIKMAQYIPQDELLRQVASVFNLDEERIQQMVKQTQQEKQQRLKDMAKLGMNDFGGNGNQSATDRPPNEPARQAAG